MPTGSNLSSNSQTQEPALQSLDEEELQSLYTWVDSIPLSRPKKNIARDFADGVLMAEIAKHYFPRLVQTHNYSAASSTQQKMYNWNTLNQKVFKKIHFQVSKAEMKDVVNARGGAIELILRAFQQKLTKMKTHQEEHEYDRSPSVQSRSNPVDYDAVDQQAPSVRSTGGGASKKSAKRSRSQPRSAPREPSTHSANNNAPPQYQPAHQNFSAPQQQMAAAVDPNNVRVKELQETVKILEAKVNKLNLLLRLKDSKIHALTEKLRQ
eukprot:CAMPEP_0117450322 /NCGR_PEP_ID=MMETSP0759-20121206/8405_1 /TAXON_ID=63605 /ORGANISM="Percolomonas cosmopolitus, Strain WS" /LENGTH=265 /DNA_ID=CAMNT_0005242833 /DNA_START=331 /DNA_END=1125 /DNA_ORIENTATION=+